MRSLFGTFRAVARGLVFRLWEPSAAPQVAVARAHCMPRLTMDAQWQRVTGVLEQATGRAAAIAEAHAMARQTWQAADYALDRLMDDLSTVMAVPARSHARAFVPVVVQPVDIRRRRLAA